MKIGGNFLQEISASCFVGSLNGEKLFIQSQRILSAELSPVLQVHYFSHAFFSSLFSPLSIWQKRALFSAKLPVVVT